MVLWLVRLIQISFVIGAVGLETMIQISILASLIYHFAQLMRAQCFSSLVLA